MTDSEKLSRVNAEHALRADGWVDPGQVLRIRGLAIEEAKRAIAAAFEKDQDISALEVLEGLAPLPASLVAVERAALERAENAIERCLPDIAAGKTTPTVAFNVGVIFGLLRAATES